MSRQKTVFVFFGADKTLLFNKKTMSIFGYYAIEPVKGCTWQKMHPANALPDSTQKPTDSKNPFSEEKKIFVWSLPILFKDKAILTFSRFRQLRKLLFCRFPLKRCKRKNLLAINRQKNLDNMVTKTASSIKKNDMLQRTTFGLVFLSTSNALISSISSSSDISELPILPRRTSRFCIHSLSRIF